MTAPFELDLSQPVPVYRQLYQRFRESIADGRLRPGDRVPAVRAKPGSRHSGSGLPVADWRGLPDCSRGSRNVCHTATCARFLAHTSPPRLLRRRIKPPTPGRCR